jgi:2-methylcitrate dehydratase PrpD
MPDLISKLVSFVVQTDYDDLSPQVIDYAKAHILDTLGVMIAGSSAPGIKPAVDLAKAWGGRKESTILFFGGKVPAPSAAFAMGPMARALDYGAVHPEANEHTTEYTLPAALPVAELKAASGKDLITAVALGNEVIVRTGASVHTVTPVGSAKTHSVFRVWGPVAAVGKLLKLNEEMMLDAMGLAYTQGGCDGQMFIDCALKCRVQHGLVTDTAIKCVLLAQQGVTGTHNMLEGAKGMYQAFFPENNPEWITKGLSQKTFEAVNTRVKGYPTCTYTHSAIETALTCVKENDIKADDIARIVVGVNKPSYEVVCTPQEFRYHPRSIVDCQFSIPYCIACAAVNRSVAIADFTDEAIQRGSIRQMMSKIVCEIDPEIQSFCPNGFDGAKVRITMKDGHEYYHRIDYVKGTPQNPMNMDEVETKFRGCLPFAVAPIPSAKVDKVIDTVRNLEKLTHVNALIEQLIP